jgi:adenylate cyclase
LNKPDQVLSSHGRPQQFALSDVSMWRRLHVRLTVLYGLATFLALTLLAVSIYRQGVDSETQNLKRRILATAESLSNSIDGDAIRDLPLTSSVLTPFHRNLLQRFRDTASADPDIRSIYVLKPTSQPTRLRFVVDYEKGAAPAAPGELYNASEVPAMIQGFARPSLENHPVRDRFGITLSGYTPLHAKEGASVAVLGVDVDASRLALIRSKVLASTLLTFAFSLLLLALIAVIVARLLQAPLTRILKATSAIALGDLSTRLDLRRDDELGLMSQHFDLMVEQLQDREFVRETFGRYLSSQIARKVLSQRDGMSLDGEERVVSVLFSDLCGYTSISEQLSPAQIVGMLNQYLEAMNLLIDEHGGCVIEYVGDAIFAVFGAPYYHANHAEQATRCALAMAERLQALNKDWLESGLAESWQRVGLASISMRIGVHSGPVIAGNLGSKVRMKYSVIGDTVNVAARLEALNKEFDSQLIISRAVCLQLPADLSCLFKDCGTISVKGREQTVRIFAYPGAAAAVNGVSEA